MILKNFGPIARLLPWLRVAGLFQGGREAFQNVAYFLF